MPDLKLYSAYELTGLPKPQYLVDGLIEERSLALIAAPSGAGKSFVAVDLACSVAMGVEFAQRHATKQRPVIYIAAEGGRSMQKRVSAWCHYRTVPLRDIPVHFVITPVRIREQEQREELLRLFDEVDPETGHEGIFPGLLIIDTLSQSFGSGDENTMDMQEFVDCMAELRDERDMAVLVIHHMNATGTRERGHTSLKAAMDHSFKVMGIKGADHRLKKVILSNDKNKDDVEAEKITFAVEPHLDSAVLKPINSRVSMESVQLRENSKQMRVLANIEEVEGDFVHTSTLKKRTGLEDKYLHQAIDDLVDLKLIKKAGHGKYFLTTRGIWTKEQNQAHIDPLRNLD